MLISENFNLNKEIENAKTICILGHISPDGDCIGSTLSMQNYILNKYADEKKIQIYLQDSSEKFNLLKGYKTISKKVDDTIYDLAILLDCASLERIGEFNKYFENAKRKIVIDHHETSSVVADAFYIDSKSPATSEICFDLYDKDVIDTQIAECLYLGIIHDTGIFRFKSTSAHTMEIVAFLMNKKIDFNKIQEKTFYTKTYKQQLISGYALQKLKQYYNKKVVYTYLTLKEMADFSVSKKEIDNIVFYIRETEDCKCAIFAYEMPSGEFKISMRSNDDNLSVADICKKYNGGGHKLAAGCFMKELPEKIIEILLMEIKEQI